MKPIIIYIKNERDTMITLTREQLEQYIQEAYQQGIQDGNTTYVPYTPYQPIPNPITTPIITWSTTSNKI